MVIWYCCSEIIYKNHASKTRSGEKIKFYRLPSHFHLYALKTVGINFEIGEHCSKGYRNSTDILDFAIPSS